MKHLIITRLGMKWKYEEVGMTWEDWYSNSIYLIDNYLRKSLRNQTNQNFELISIVDETCTTYGDVLPNERILHKHQNETLKNVLNNNLKYDGNILITRIDRDDMIANSFVESLQQSILTSNPNYYYDLKSIYKYDVPNDKFYLSYRYTIRISPFVSAYESINKEGKIKCYPYSTGHTKVNTLLNGKKIDNLHACQVIHDHNVLNKIDGIQLGDDDTLHLKKIFGI